VLIYDIKNTDEIISSRDSKPRMEVIGPFVFDLRRQKDAISFAGDNLHHTPRGGFTIFRAALVLCLKHHRYESSSPLVVVVVVV
jgi:hypothetical protein